MQKNKIEAVIFDMDGVIFNTEAVWKDAFFASNKKFGIDVTEEYRQTQMAGRNDADIRAAMKIEFPNVDIDAYRDHMRKMVQETITTSKDLLKNGFVEIVGMLKENGIKIALATSSQRKRCEILFANAGLEMSDIFDATVTGEDVSKSKPDPEIFLTAMQKVNADPQNSIVFEDSILGLQAGFASGAKTVMVVDLIEPNEEFKKITENVVYSLVEAKNYILSLIS